MQIVPIKELYNKRYFLEVQNGMKLFWKNHKQFSCINTPKKVNMLLYADGVCGEYKTKENDVIRFESGDVVYLPVGSEYILNLHDFTDENSNTVGINFFAYDQEKQPIVFSKHIKVFHAPVGVNYKMLFSKTDAYSGSVIPCPAKVQAATYEILSALSEIYTEKRRNKFEMIMNGVNYLESTEDYALSLEEVSELCNVCPSYFRRLFKEYSGMTPMEYMMKSKIERAKMYLKYENLSVAEIGELLNFTDASYFAKQFRARTGLSPLAYRKQILNML